MQLKAWIVAASFAALAGTAWALPSVQDVESAVKQGHTAQAETMMKEVVDARPNSAKGHYLYAEILARNGRYDLAVEQAAAAERLDPAIGFTQAEKFRAFQRLLAREQARSAPAAPRSEVAPAGGFGRSAATPDAVSAAPAAPAPASGGIPGWVWLAGLAVAGVALWRGFSRSRAASTGGAAASYGAGSSAATTPYGYGAQAGQMPGGTAPYPGGPGYPVAPAAGGGNSWLGTGLAAAGGVAAGMMLDRALHGGQGGQGVTGHPALSPDPDLNADLSRLSTSGVGADDDAARQLSERDVDFGTGNDWGGDDAGGSFDAGSSDDGWS